MHTEKKLWLAIGILGVLLLASSLSLLYAMKEGNERLALEIGQARETLSGELASARQVLEEQDEQLSDRLDASVMALRQESEARERELRLGLSGLEGKIGEVEERSSELEQRIVDLNIKSQDFSAIVEETLESVVSIVTDVGIGSGAIVDEEGYVVTNAHVIAGATKAGARTIDGEIHSVRLVALDAQADLALLQISGSNFDALGFERALDVRVGTKVIALGSPAGLEFTVTEGIVSAVDRENEYGVPMIQTDVPINPGNSGGPIVNIRGSIVGISTYKALGYESLGFAVQSDVVREFVEDAIAEDLRERAGPV